jgi:16S rRNA (uracil1498-N3)-methyltransferase
MIRIYVDDPLEAGLVLAPDERQSHYLTRVMRRKEGDALLVFNEAAGEWRARIESLRPLRCLVIQQMRSQAEKRGPWLLAAPLRGGRTEDMVEKGTELGMQCFRPVLTRRSVVDKVNETRLRQIAREASEQCERLDVPEILPALPLEAALASLPPSMTLLYGDESGASEEAGALLPRLAERGKDARFAALLGPEGGFAPEEFTLLRASPHTYGVSLGPRILRADTAALTLLALLQCFFGDWNARPAFR